MEVVSDRSLKPKGINPHASSQTGSSPMMAHLANNHTANRTLPRFNSRLLQQNLSIGRDLPWLLHLTLLSPDSEPQRVLLMGESAVILHMNLFVCTGVHRELERHAWP